MLVLGRKVGEEVILTNGVEEIRLTLVRVGPGSCRLGVTAPLTWEVSRPDAIKGKPAQPVTETATR
jgi:sRNA-binding carbon storage regulator CsrA